MRDSASASPVESAASTSSRDPRRIRSPEGSDRSTSLGSVSPGVNGKGIVASLRNPIVRNRGRYALLYRIRAGPPAGLTYAHGTPRPPDGPPEPVFQHVSPRFHRRDNLRSRHAAAVDGRMRLQERGTGSCGRFAIQAPSGRGRAELVPLRSGAGAVEGSYPSRGGHIAESLRAVTKRRRSA